MYELLHDVGRAVPAEAVIDGGKMLDIKINAAKFPDPSLPDEIFDDCKEEGKGIDHQIVVKH